MFDFSADAITPDSGGGWIAVVLLVLNIVYSVLNNKQLRNGRTFVDWIKGKRKSPKIRDVAEDTNRSIKTLSDKIDSQGRKLDRTVRAIGSMTDGLEARVDKLEKARK